MRPAPAPVGSVAAPPPSAMAASAGRATRRRSRPVMVGVFGVLVAVAVLGAVGWRVAGGSLFTIATPSMCPEMCVGTLVLDRPLHGPVHAGEVVTFRPPGTATVFTHRVVKVLPDGSFKTAGDASGRTDPWTVARADVIGRVVAHVGGLGWVLRSLPWLAASLAVFLVLRRVIPASARTPADVLYLTMAVVVPVLLMRPLVRASVIAWHLRRGAGLVMTVVNTGLLPAGYSVTGGRDVAPVAPGHLVTLTASPGSGGAVSLHDVAALSGWQWALAALVVLLPMLGIVAWTASVRLLPPPTTPDPPPPGRRSLSRGDGPGGTRYGEVRASEKAPVGADRAGRRRRGPPPEGIDPRGGRRRLVAAGAEGSRGP